MDKLIDGNVTFSVDVPVDPRTANVLPDFPKLSSLVLRSQAYPEKINWYQSYRYEFLELSEIAKIFYDEYGKPLSMSYI